VFIRYQDQANNTGLTRVEFDIAPRLFANISLSRKQLGVHHLASTWYGPASRLNDLTNYMPVKVFNVADTNSTLVASTLAR
jgi:hypothetical protein